MTPQGIHVISWSEVDQIIDMFARRLKDARVDTIMGISRAGLVPAVMLSHRLGVRDFAVLDILRTKSDDVEAGKSAPESRGILNEAKVRGRRVCLVDDIVGEGATLRLARSLLGGVCSSLIACALVVNQGNFGEQDPRSIVDCYGCLVHGWVVFPWEGKEPSRGGSPCDRP